LHRQGFADDRVFMAGIALQALRRSLVAADLATVYRFY
jgi:hypothetical protein